MDEFSILGFLFTGCVTKGPCWPLQIDDSTLNNLKELLYIMNISSIMHN